MELGRLPKHILLGELPKGKGKAKGGWKDRVRRLGEEMKAFDIKHEG